MRGGVFRFLGKQSGESPRGERKKKTEKRSKPVARPPLSLSLSLSSLLLWAQRGTYAVAEQNLKVHCVCEEKARGGKTEVFFVSRRRVKSERAPKKKKKKSLRKKSISWRALFFFPIDLSNHHPSMSSPSSPSPHLRVAALFAYPVKSCAPIELDQQGAALTRDGIPFDRNWAVVRADDADGGRGRFLSQRDTPALALVRPSLPAEAFLGQVWGADLGAGAALTLTIVPTGKSVSVPLWTDEEEEVEEEVEGEEGGAASPSSSPRRRRRLPRRQLRRVSVWDYDGEALDEGDEAAELLSDFLGRRVRLVRHAPSRAPRAVAPGWVRASSPRAEVAFADAFPLLVTTRASTLAVERVLGRPVEAVRFRPNILLDAEGGFAGGGEGAEGFGKPWEEDAWASLSFSNGGPSSSSSSSLPLPPSAVLVDLVKPCDRCSIPHVNPRTGERDSPDLTRALRDGCGRSGAKLGWLALPSWRGAVFFGWNGVVRDKGGLEHAKRGEVLCVVRVGDGVRVAERRGEGEGPRGPFLTSEWEKD
jgi:uncharacterized protein YcbX